MYVDEQTRNTSGWLLLGLLVLGLILLLCMCNGSRNIETNLLDQGQAALADAGFDPELLKVAGRDLTLEGVVPDEAARLAASEALVGLEGVRRFSNNLTLQETADSDTTDTNTPTTLTDLSSADAAPDALRGPELDISLTPEGAVLSGLVPTGARQDIIAAATELFGADNLTDNLEVADDVAAPDWLDGVLGILPTVNANVDGAGFSANNDALTLRGLATDEAARDTVAALAAESLELPIQNDIQLLASEKGPPVFDLQRNDDGAVLSGTVAAATRAPLVEAASALVGEDNVTDNLTVDDNVAAPAWPPAVAALLPGLANDTPDLSFGFTDDTLTLRGTVPSEEAGAAITAQVQAATPDISVANQFIVATDAAPEADAAATDAEIPASLNLSVTEDGITLGGNLPQTAADAASEAISDLGPVTSDVQIAGADLATPDWFDELLSLTPQLAAETEGLELTATASEITLDGSVASEDIKTALSERLTELADGATVTNNIIVDTSQTDANNTETDTSGGGTPDGAEAEATDADSLDVSSDTIADGSAEDDNGTSNDDAAGGDATGEATDEQANGPSVVGATADTASADTASDAAEDSDAATSTSGTSDAATTETTDISTDAASTDTTTSNTETIDSASGDSQQGEATEVGSSENADADPDAGETEAETSVGDADGGETEANTTDADAPGDASSDTAAESSADASDIIAGSDTSGDTTEATGGEADRPDIVGAVANTLSAEATSDGPEGNDETAFAGNTSYTSTAEATENATSDDATAATTDTSTDAAGTDAVTIDTTTDTTTTDTATGDTRQSEAIDNKDADTNPNTEAAPATEAPLESPGFSVQFEDNGVTLSGTVSEETATQLSSIGGDVSGSSNLTAADVATPDWLGDIVNLLPDYAEQVSDAALSVEGDRVTLDGVVSNEATKTDLTTAISEVVPDSVEIINNLQVEEPVAATLNISNEDGELNVSGNVPAPVIDNLTSAAADTTVSSSNTPAENVQTPDWLADVASLAPTLTRELQDGTLSIEGDTVIVSGTAPSEAKKTELLDSIETVVGDAADVIDNISVASPSPTELSVQVNAAGIYLDGNVSEDIATRLSDAASRLANDQTVQSDLTVADNLETPAWLPDLISALPEYGIDKPGLRYSEGRLTLSGAVPSEARKAELGDELARLLDDGTTITNNLTVDPSLPVNNQPIEDATVAAATPESTASDLPAPSLRVDIAGNNVRLSGTVASEDRRNAAATGYAGKTIDNAITTGNVSDPPYLGNVLAVSSQLAEDLERATLSLEGQTVTLQGVASSSGERDRIAAYVTSALTPNITVVNRLTVEANTSISTEDGK